MTVELSDPEMMRYNRQIVLRGLLASAGSAAPPRNTWPRRAWAG